MVGPLEADHHGEREHHLSRVDLVDVDDVDGKRNRHRTLRICRIRRRILQVRVRNYHLGKIFKKEKKRCRGFVFSKKRQTMNGATRNDRSDNLANNNWQNIFDSSKQPILSKTIALGMFENITRQ